MTKLSAPALITLLFAVACTPPPEPTPALTPDQAVVLLNNSSKAKEWLIYAQKKDSTCQWRVTLPEQAGHPAEIDADHVMFCRVTPNPRELDASAVYTYDKKEQRWTLTDFRS